VTGFVYVIEIEVFVNPAAKNQMAYPFRTAGEQDSNQDI